MSEKNQDMKQLPGGLWPVMLTPFKEDGELDMRSLEELTEFYMEAGSAGLFTNCLSGEMFQLTSAERLKITEAVVRRTGDRIPVVATGNFGMDVSNNVSFIKRIYESGVKSVVLNTNQLIRASGSEGDLKSKLEELLILTEDIPLGIYECPVPYKRLISAELAEWMGKTGRFLYYKETSCDPRLLREKISATDGSSMGLFNANTPTALQSLKDGALGLSTTGANYYPEFFDFLFRKVKQKEIDAGAEQVNEIITLFDSFVDGTGYPLLAKIFLHKRGLNILPVCRTLVPSLPAQAFIKLERLMEFIDREAESIGIDLVKL